MNRVTSEFMDQGCCEELLLGRKVCWDSLDGTCPGEPRDTPAAEVYDPAQLEILKDRHPVSSPERLRVEEDVRRLDHKYLNHYAGPLRDIPYLRQQVTAGRLALDIDGVSGTGFTHGIRGNPVIAVWTIGTLSPENEMKVRALYPRLNVEIISRGVPCDSVGGTCRSSPMDGTFGADCEREFGEITRGDAACRVANQSCCVKPANAAAE